MAKARDAGACDVVRGELVTVHAERGKVVGVGVQTAEKIAETVRCGAVVNAAGPYAVHVDGMMREAVHVDGGRRHVDGVMREANGGGVRLRNEVR